MLHNLIHVEKVKFLVLRALSSCQPCGPSSRWLSGALWRPRCSTILITHFEIRSLIGPYPPTYSPRGQTYFNLILKPYSRQFMAVISQPISAGKNGHLGQTFRYKEKTLHTVDRFQTNPTPFWPQNGLKTAKGEKLGFSLIEILLQNLT